MVTTDEVRRGERIARMVPERRAMDETLRTLQEESGPMHVDVVEGV